MRPKEGACPDRCQSRRRWRCVGGLAGQRTPRNGEARADHAVCCRDCVACDAPAPNVILTFARGLSERLEQISGAPTGSSFLRGSTRCARTRSHSGRHRAGDSPCSRRPHGQDRLHGRNRNPLNHSKPSHRPVTFHWHGHRLEGSALSVPRPCAMVRDSPHRYQTVLSGLKRKITPTLTRTRAGRDRRDHVRLDGAAPESNRPSVGLQHRTGFEGFAHLRLERLALAVCAPRQYVARRTTCTAPYPRQFRVFPANRG